MRKLVFTLIAIFSLTACSNASNKENKDTEVKTEKKEDAKVKVIQLTKAEFLTKITNFEASSEWKYLGDKPALIDFYATWCGPCKAVAPILEELAEEYKDEIYIYKVDTDQEQELSTLFGIRSIPSLLFIPMEGQPQMAQGAAPKPDLKKAIDEVLLNKKEEEKKD